MNILQSSIQERLRSIVGMNGWDYCVFWKLDEDHGCLEWMGCCCGGAEIVDNGEQLFTVSSFGNNNNSGGSCRDVLFPHPRTRTCDLLAEFPTSIELDSGIHAQAFLSSQARWINFSDSTIRAESSNTRVLIPIPCGGLVELFVSKHVPEDPQLIQLVSTQCKNDSWAADQQQKQQQQQQQHQLMIVRDNTLHNFHFSTAQPEFPPSPHINEGLERDPLSNFDDSVDPHREDVFCSSPSLMPKNSNTQSLNLFQPWPDNLPWDDPQIRFSNSPLAFLGQQFAPPSNRHDIFLEGSTDSVISDKPSLNSIDHGFQDIVALQHSLRTTHLPRPQFVESPHACGGANPSKELANDKDLIKPEVGRAESISDCSDQMEDDDDQKVVGRSGRRHQSKNLVAERKRRKKLNERLYSLRALVPKITKMDRASILGDAIEYVIELQKQAKEFQDELEEIPDEEGDQQGTPLEKQNGTNHQHKNNIEHEESPNGLRIGIDQGTRCSSSTKTTELPKQNNDSISTDDKAQQMEVQVEVNQVDGHEFNLKIFCEKKSGGFVRLMQAMDVLGLEVIHVNITTFRGLVLNVFKAVMRDNEVIQPEQVRDSLLELTRNPNGWTEAVRAGESGSVNHHPKNHHHHQHLHHHHHHHL